LIPNLSQASGESTFVTDPRSEFTYWPHFRDSLVSEIFVFTNRDGKPLPLFDKTGQLTHPKTHFADGTYDKGCIHRL